MDGIGLRPRKLALLRRAIRQIGIDQLLIGDARRDSLCLEVVDHLTVKIDRDLFLELLGIGIFTSTRKIIFFSHAAHLLSRHDIVWIRLWLLSSRK